MSLRPYWKYSLKKGKWTKVEQKNFSKVLKVPDIFKVKRGPSTDKVRGQKTGKKYCCLMAENFIVSDGFYFSEEIRK